jgi:hypothetical protein
VSTHSTKYIRVGFTNECEGGSEILGHAGEALQMTNTGNLPGQFVSKDRMRLLKATLRDVSYNEKANFNLLSLS